MWKEKTIKDYGNVLLTISPKESWFKRIQIMDKDFKNDKENYINAKGAWLDKERQAGRSSGLD